MSNPTIRQLYQLALEHWQNFHDAFCTGGDPDDPDEALHHPECLSIKEVLDKAEREFGLRGDNE